MNWAENNSPIHLVGPSAIVYEDIANYMGMKRKVVSVDPDLVNGLAAEEGTELINHVHGGEINVDVRLINSSYTAV